MQGKRSTRDAAVISGPEEIIRRANAPSRRGVMMHGKLLVATRAPACVCLLLAILAAVVAPPLLAQSHSESVPQINEALLADTDDIGVPPPRELSDQPTGFSERHPRYRLHRSDVLDLAFAFAPEFDQTVTIQPDGFIALRVVGDLHVEGKTVPELTNMLHKSYQTVLKQPNIRVELKDFQQPYFVVGGQVGRPGKYELRDSTTVAEAVAIAGGLTGSSKHSQILLFRVRSEQWVQVIPINLKDLLEKGQLLEDPYLRPGDMVYVPKNFLSKIKEFFPRASLRPW